MKRSRELKLWGAGILATGGILLALTPPDAEASPLEDEPGWSCVDDGNRVCGPSNTEGKTPGCYDDGGVLSAYWPCAPWQPSDGWVHGDGTITYPDGPCDPGPDSDRPCTIAQADSDDPDEAVYQHGYNN